MREKDDFLPRPSYVEPSFGNSGSSGRGKLRLPLYVGGAPGYTMATPGVKKSVYVSATRKKTHFAVRSAMCIYHLTRKPPQRSKLCSFYWDVRPWRDVGCRSPQLTSLGRRFQPQQLGVLQQMHCHLLCDFCTKQKMAVEQSELGHSLFFSKVA